MLEITSVITNGYVDATTIAKLYANMTIKGWTFMCTIPAKVVHPHSLDNDKLTVFGRYQETKPTDNDEEEANTCE